MLNKKQTSPELASKAGKALSGLRKPGKGKKTIGLKLAKSGLASVLAQSRLRCKSIGSRGFNDKTSLSRKPLLGVKHSKIAR